MSRVTRWKLEKTKVKVVFRLQFHATHIPQIGWDKLHLSFIPVDLGKATAKTTKANVRNGSCKWSDPVYETTRLLQDSKTKHYEDKLYKLIIAMGSSRSSVLGEATINLADYADASKPAVVQLPLQGPDLGAVLHVTVQLLTSKTGFREFDQQREISERGLQGTVDQDGLKNISGDIVTSHVEKKHLMARTRWTTKSGALNQGKVVVRPNIHCNSHQTAHIFSTCVPALSSAHMMSSSRTCVPDGHSAIKERYGRIESVYEG